MEEQIKLESLKDVLVELQKLQLEYHGEYAIHIDTYESGSIDMYIGSPYDGLFEFSAIDDCSAWKTTYNRVFDFLKQLNNEE